ncbi:MAG: PAS domain S-box protein, partial [Candidatus Hydrogenedentales bacterium]
MAGASSTSPNGNARVAALLRDGRPYICNDLAADPVASLLFDKALEAGLQSAAAIPVPYDNHVGFLLTICSTEKNVFNEKEVNLLGEVASTVSLGLERIERERERKRAEEALLQSEETYRVLVESLPDIVLRFDRNARHLFASRNTEVVTGVSAGQLIGKTHREVGMPESVCILAENAIRAVFDSGNPYEAELEVPVKGKKATFNCRLLPEFDARGTVLSVLSISRDVTAHRRMEIALESEASRRRILMEACRDGIAIFNQGHKVVEANPGFCQMLGYTPEETLNLHTWDFEAVMSQERIRTDFADLTQINATFESSHRRKGGQIVDVEVTASGAMVAGEPLVLTVVRDISQRKRDELALRESEARYRALVETSSDWVWETDRSGRYTFISNRVADILGFAPDEMIHQTRSDFMPEDEAMRTREVFEGITAAHRSFHSLEIIG